jgi:serine/threonine protein kinase
MAALSACAGSTARPPSQAGSRQQQAGASSSGSNQGQMRAVDEDATCHIEVVEYCDLGNLTTAIRNHIFSLDSNAGNSAMQRSYSRGRSCRSSTASSHHSHHSVDEDGSVGTEGSMQQQLQQLQGQGTGAAIDPSTGGSSSSSGRTARLRLNMRWLLLTLLEVAEGMAYLHRMGVVHCDLKPANVLLKSSNADVRGFTAKVSDFGLSRVEDDDTCATFPFNSCGTAAYVAPEALITTKKVGPAPSSRSLGSHSTSHV